MVDMFKVTPFDHPVGSPSVMVAAHTVKMIEDASFHEEKKDGAAADSTVALEKPVVAEVAPIVRTKITFMDDKVLMVREPMSSFEMLLR
jgi:hypothetical protein